jgi:hypothetical protein
MRWLWAMMVVVAGVMTLGQTRPAADGAVRFMPVTVVVDSGKSGLGAYQVEVTAKGASFVGLEGGEAAAFKDAPFYDPAALRNTEAGKENRIIVAAFSLEEAAKLPQGTTRVATIHLAVNGAGGGNPEMTGKLVVAADHDGATIKDAAVRLVFPSQQGEMR